MSMLIRALPLLLEFALLVYTLIDCAQTPETEVRNLPKVLWIILIVLLPIVGPVAWLVAGRPLAQYPARPQYSPGFPETDRANWRPMSPDDDDEFLRQVGQINREHEQTLKQWEADLKRREDELRGKTEGQDPTEA